MFDKLEAELASHKAAREKKAGYYVAPDIRKAMYDEVFSLHEPDDVLDGYFRVAYCDAYCCDEPDMAAFWKAENLYRKWASGLSDPGLKSHARMRLTGAWRRAPGLIPCKWKSLFAAAQEAVVASSDVPAGETPPLAFAKALRIDALGDCNYFTVEEADINGDGEVDLLYLVTRTDCHDKCHVLFREKGRIRMVDVSGRVVLLLERSRNMGMAFVVQLGAYMGGTISSMRIMGLRNGRLVGLAPEREIAFEDGVTCSPGKGDSPAYGRIGCSVFYSQSKGRGKPVPKVMKWDGTRLIEPDKR